jgi:cytochrome c556
MTTSFRSSTLAAIAAAVLSVAAQGQQQPQQQQTPPSPQTTRPLIPVAASTLLAGPDAFIGEPVSLAAIVDAHLSRTAFSVDHDREVTAGRDVLVIAPTLQRSPAVNAAVTVIGEVARFDAAAIASKVAPTVIDLPADVAARYAGKTVVIATSVVDDTGTDLARRLPPPMTADEVALQKLMKQVGTSRGALQKAVEGSDAKTAAEHAALLKKTFVDVEAFWRSRRQGDPAKLAADARRSAEAIERGAAAARWDEVKTQAGALATACQTCHQSHRERFDDGSFRIKKPGTR